MNKLQSFKNFRSAFIKTKDYSKLSSLIVPLLSNFIYKNRKFDSWKKILRKCTTILKTIYTSNFEIGFQHKRFSYKEHKVLENIFRLIQRIQSYTNDSVDELNTKYFLYYALCFEPKISIQAFKVISMYRYKDIVLQGNPIHIEILLKLINLPEVKTKKVLYDKPVTINKTYSTLVEDPFEYFNNNKNDKNISDLYLETHKILCSEEEAFLIKNYCIITIGKLINDADTFMKNIKNRLIENNDEMIFLFIKFVHFLLKTPYDRFKISEILVKDGFLDCILKFNENTSFEHNLLFTIIHSLNFDIKFSLTSQVSNPDLDYQYYLEIYDSIKKCNDGFPKCLDLEDYKKLFDTFDIVHKNKDKITLKIIFKIMNETYKKSSAYIEPFECSQYLKKCITLIKGCSIEFSHLCLTTIIYFIKDDPLTIPKIAKQGILEIYDITSDDYESNVLMLNLLDILSSDNDLSDKVIQGNLITKMLYKLLFIQDLKSVGFVINVRKFLSHHPAYKVTVSEFVKNNLEQTNVTSGFVMFSNVLMLRDDDFKVNKFDLLLKTIRFALKKTFKKDNKWKTKFYKSLRSQFFSFQNDPSILEELDKFCVQKKDLKDLDLTEICLFLLCQIFNKIRPKPYTLRNYKFNSLFQLLLDIIIKITDYLTDISVLDFFDIKDISNMDIYRLIWCEVCYILDFIWFIEDKENKENLVFSFLNLFINKQSLGNKRTKSNDLNTTHTRACLYNILVYNIGKWKNYNLSKLMDWFCLNHSAFSIHEICEILDNIVEYNFDIKTEHFNWISDLLYRNEFDNKILKFFDNFLAQIHKVNNDIKTLQHINIEDNLHIVDIYKKYYSYRFDIRYKAILNEKSIYDKVIKDLNFKVFYDKIDISMDIVKYQFYNTEDFINLYIYTLKYATFNNIIIDVPSRLEIIIKSKVLSRKLKMKYILTYFKYIKSQRKDLVESKKILNFILKFIKKKKLLVCIKCIIHQIFHFSKNLIYYDVNNYADFIDDNYSLCFYDINLFKEIFKNFLDNKTKTSISRIPYYDTKIFFKYIMKISLLNPDILPILTEILYNNTNYFSLINKKFIRKVIAKYIDNENPNNYSKGFNNALNFLVLCLKFNDLYFVSFVYKAIIRKMRKCVNFKIFNYILILYDSLDNLCPVENRFGFTVETNEFSFNLSEFYVEHKIADEIFFILTKIKESDLHHKNVYNTIGIPKWDNIRTENRSSYIFAFLRSLYHKNNDEPVDNYTAWDYYKDCISKIISPEGSTKYDSESSRDSYHEPKLRNESDGLCSSYYLWEEEFKLLEKSKKKEFIKTIGNIFKKEYDLIEIESNSSDEDNDTSDNTKSENSDKCEVNELEDIEEFEDESSIGEEDGIIPDIPVENINEMNEQEVNEFIKQWYDYRKSQSSYYIPVDKDFIYQLSEDFKTKFEDSERLLKDDYFIYAPDYESIKEDNFEGKDTPNFIIDSKIFKGFFSNYLTTNWTVQKDFAVLLKTFSLTQILKLDILQIINDKLFFCSSKELIHKCIQILQFIIILSKKDIGAFTKLIKNLMEIAKDRIYTRSILYILSHLYINEEYENEILIDIFEITNLGLLSKSREYLIQFCKNNINIQIIELIILLLNNKDKSIYLITDLSLKYLKMRKDNSITERIKNNTYFTDSIIDAKDQISLKNCLDKLIYLLDENSIDCINLTLFGIFEEFVCLYKQSNEEFYEKYKYKREKLESCINDHQEEINDLIYSNDIILRFLSKFDVLDFVKKKTYVYTKIDTYNNDSFYLTVSKNNILSDSFFQIMRKSPEELKAIRIMVIFSNESGVDFGGWTKEWLALLFKAAINPDKGLFVVSSDKNNTVLPYRYSCINPDHLLFFRFIGRMLGFIIIDRYNVGINFAKSIFKFLLNKKCSLEDLKEVDTLTYNNLVWIKNNNIDNVLNLTFTVENDYFGINENIELIPNGKNIKLTDNNKNEFIDLIVNYKLVLSIERQLCAIKEGFFEMIDEDLINLFNEKELELLICGIPEINVDDWRNNTEYKGYTNSSRNIIWFWQVVEEMTSEERALLLDFCTGSSRVIYEGFRNLQTIKGLQKFKIETITYNEVPSAVKSFNRLDLPEYSTYEELKKNIFDVIIKEKTINEQFN